MKKIDNRRLDAKLTTLLNESSAPTSKQLADIRERAKAEYLRSAPPQRNSGTKKLRRVAMIAAAVAVLLLVPLVVTIIFPVTISNASDFVKRAKLWLNDTFCLNIEVSVPPEEDNEKVYNETKILYSAEEAASYIGKNILVFDESTNCILDYVEVRYLPANIFLVTLNYKYNNSEVRVSLETLMDVSIDILNYSANEVLCKPGKLWTWVADNIYRALGYIGEWEISISASVDETTASSLFSKIIWLN